MYDYINTYGESEYCALNVMQRGMVYDFDELLESHDVQKMELESQEWKDSSKSVMIKSNFIIYKIRNIM